MAPTGSSTGNKRKSTTSASTAAKKSKSNLGTSTWNGLVSVQTEQEEEQDYAQRGIDRIIISDEEGNVTSVKDISSQASDVMEEEDDEVELST